MAYTTPIAFGSITATNTAVPVNGSIVYEKCEFISIDSTLNQPIVIELVTKYSESDSTNSSIYIRANATPVTIPTSAWQVYVKAVGTLPTAGDLVINGWR